MKYFLKNLFVLLGLISYAELANAASVMENCMTKVQQSNETWTNVLDTEIFPDASELTQEYVTAKKPKILTALAGNVLAMCTDTLGQLANDQIGTIRYNRNGKRYGFQFKTYDLFDYLQMPLGIMVYNKTNLNPGDVIQLSDIPRGSAGRYWSDECSDHSIWEGVDMDTAVVKAGKQAFTDYMTNSRNEFFIDFPEGDDRRAFPGLIILDKRGSTTEEIVRYSNLVKAKTVAQNFATGLKNNAGCQNQNLAVYVVNTNITKNTGGTDAGWITGASIGGVGVGALVGSGIATAIGAGTATFWGGLAAGTATVGWVPVAGWIVAAVGAVTAGVSMMIPSEIQHIEQVMVMDGPYII